MVSILSFFLCFMGFCLDVEAFCCLEQPRSEVVLAAEEICPKVTVDIRDVSTTNVVGNFTILNDASGDIIVEVFITDPTTAGNAFGTGITVSGTCVHVGQSFCTGPFTASSTNPACSLTIPTTCANCPQTPSPTVTAGIANFNFTTIAEGSTAYTFCCESTLPCEAKNVNITNPQFGLLGIATISNDAAGSLTVDVKLDSTFASFFNSIGSELTIGISGAFGGCSATLPSSCSFTAGEAPLPPAVACSFSMQCEACPATPSGTVTVNINATTVIDPIAGSETTDYTFCCADVPRALCTRTKGYWACHLDSWPQGLEPSKQFCDLPFVILAQSCPDCNGAIPQLTLGQILNADDTGKPWYTLAKEWVAAYINIYNIYGPNSFVGNAPFIPCVPCPECGDGCFGYDAFFYTLFVLNNEICNRDSSTLVLEQLATCLTPVLKDFNEGFVGGECPDFCRDYVCCTGSVTPTCEACAELNCPIDCRKCKGCAHSCPLSSTSSSSSSSSSSSWFSSPKE